MFPQHFSDSARGIHGRAQREFTDSDVYVLNTIFKLRGKGMRDWEDIRKHLNDGFLDMQLPVVTPAFDAQTSLTLQYVELSALKSRIEEYEKKEGRWESEKAELEQRLQAFQERINRLEIEKSEIALRTTKETIQDALKERDSRVDQLTKYHREEIADFIQKIGELQKQIGRLEGQLERKADDADE